MLKEEILTRTPQPLVYRAKVQAQRFRVFRSGITRALTAARPADDRLTMDDLRRLDAEFPAQGAGVIDAAWTDAAIRERAARRIALMSALLGDVWESATTVLETGVGDGVMAMLMQEEHGKQVTANDHQTDELHPDVLSSGIDFVASSAADMPLPDDHFDLVISFDAYEHFDDPAGVLDEAIRVCRPGGTVYTRFGPLYRSSDGLHAGARLGVPFASVLFDKATLDEFVEDSGREQIHHSYCNEWSLEQFRELFESRSERLQTLQWFEHLDLHGIEIINRYPDVFKRTSPDVEEFLVAYPELMLRKN